MSEPDTNPADLQARIEALETELSALRQQQGSVLSSSSRPGRTNREFRDMAEANKFGAWLCDPEGQLIYASQTMLDLLRMSMEEAKGFGWLKRLAPHEAERITAAWLECVRTGAMWDEEFEIIRPVGSHVTLLSRGGPVADASGRTTHWAGINLDISERKLRENAVADARDKAEERNLAKDRFLAMLSHELRTPLTPIALAAAGWEMSPEFPQALREDLAMIQRNMDMEVHMIDDLLDLNRFTSGKVALHLQATDVHRELGYALETCHSEIHNKGLELRQELQATRSWAMADPARLRQVFWNLVRNACKFTPEGGRITVRTMDTGEKIRVEISDTGIGISPENRQRIFAAFEQGVGHVRERFGGLGLGLAIASEVVHLHHGQIWAESDGPGHGSTFVVELPTTASPAMQRPEKPKMRNLEARPMHILLVEDHEDTARVMARLLRTRGHTVMHASTGHQALQFAATERFDVVLSDLGLPDMNGLELMNTLKQRHGLHGIALSGYGTEEDILASEVAGFSQHLTKPIDPHQLEMALRKQSLANGPSQGQEA